MKQEFKNIVNLVVLFVLIRYAPLGVLALGLILYMYFDYRSLK